MGTCRWDAQEVGVRGALLIENKDRHKTLEVAQDDRKLNYLHELQRSLARNQWWWDRPSMGAEKLSRRVKTVRRDQTEDRRKAGACQHPKVLWEERTAGQLTFVEETVRGEPGGAALQKQHPAQLCFRATTMCDHTGLNQILSLEEPFTHCQFSFSGVLEEDSSAEWRENTKV